MTDAQTHQVLEPIAVDEPLNDPLDRHRFPIDPWKLREVKFSSDDLGVTETLFSVSNGYLGLRGNVEEGRESHTHGTFINGFHETWPIHHAEEAYGFARVGQTIVNVPDAKLLRIYVGEEPLLLPVAELERYERTLDMKEGVLHRDLVWIAPSGIRVGIRSRRMTSFVERHLAVMTYEVTLLDADAPVMITSSILNRQDGEDEYHVAGASLGGAFDPRKAEQLPNRVLNADVYWQKGNRSVLSYRTTSSGMTLAVAADHTITTDNAYEMHSSIGPENATQEFRIDAKHNVPILITKAVAYHTSRGVPPRELVDRCCATLQRVTAVGIEQQFDEQRNWMAEFWDRSDVELPGQPAAQQAVRWNLFELLQASGRAEASGIPAKGLTGSGYSGHYFWDSEIYALPFLTYTSPKFARNALNFRYTMLDAARARARELNEDGALYPWRTINGLEASAYYAAGTAQYHIDADIAYAIRQYVLASGDEQFLVTRAADILIETARMWADLGFWRANGDNTFHIHGVTGPDEYTTVVNDNLYTNVMARANLRSAVQAAEHIERDHPVAYEELVHRLKIREGEVESWRLAAEGMFIPFDEALDIHPQDSSFLEKELWDLAATDPAKHPLLLHYHPLVIYRFQVLKQADVVLALFLQSDQFTLEEKTNDFLYYDPLTTGDSSLSSVVQSIIASEIGHQELALAYFQEGLYLDLANTHSNTSDGVHIASTGGVWSALVCGFGGMRDSGSEVTLDPRLPEIWEGLTFRLTLRGTRVRFDLTQTNVTLTVEAGTHASIRIRGEQVTVHLGIPVTVPLEAAPRILGTSTIRDIEGQRRSDGSLMTSVVPPHPND